MIQFTGSCHGLSPLGSHECGFCHYQFLSARSPTRRVQPLAPGGLDRVMQRAPARPIEVGRGHTRSLTGEAHKRDEESETHSRLGRRCRLQNAMFP